MNVAYERREDPIKLKEIFITWGPTERKESGVWWRNRQEGKAELDDVWGGSGRGSLPATEPRASPDPPLTATCPRWHSSARPSYLACLPGVWGRWAWTVVPDLPNSQPEPGTRNSSPAASQRSGGDGGVGRSEH